jgi:hypothetical protein
VESTNANTGYTVRRPPAIFFEFFFLFALGQRNSCHAMRTMRVVWMRSSCEFRRGKAWNAKRIAGFKDALGAETGWRRPSINATFRRMNARHAGVLAARTVSKVNAQVRLGEVVDIDVANHQVLLSGDEMKAPVFKENVRSNVGVS